MVDRLISVYENEKIAPYLESTSGLAYVKSLDKQAYLLRLLTDELFIKAALFVVQPVVDRREQDVLWRLSGCDPQHPKIVFDML